MNDKKDDPEIIEKWHAACQFIRNVRDNFDESGQCVLVHCLAGMSRSPSLVAAFLLFDAVDRGVDPMEVEEALQFIKERKRNIRPNPKFVSALSEFARSLN